MPTNFLDLYLTLGYNLYSVIGMDVHTLTPELSHLGLLIGTMIDSIKTLLRIADEL